MRACLLGIVIAVVLLTSTDHHATAHPLPELDIHALERERLHHAAEFLVAPPDLGLDAVQDQPFLPLAMDGVNRGISQQAHWMRVRLRNSGPDPVSWVVYHETAYIDQFHVYLISPDGDIEAHRLSDRVPVHQRPLDYRRLATAHETPADSYTDVYLRISHDRADSVTLASFVASPGVFQRMAMQENLIHGAYFGAMLVLTVFALVIAALMRQRTYLHYALFLAATLLMWAMLNGYAYQYLWPDSVFLHNEGIHIAFLLVSLTALQFSKHFLQTARLMPVFHVVLSLLQLIMLGGIALRFAGFYVPVLYLSYASLSLLALLPLLAVVAYRRGLHYVRWYAAAWLVYAIGLGLSVLSAATTVFSWGMAPLVYAQAAGLLEAVLLLIALGERLVSWESERRKALELANQDPLTGLGNRRVLRQSMELLRQRHLHTREPVFLLLIDLDGFKHINDRHGHAAGDLVLRELARLLRRSCRADDSCIRYGGEEFVVLFQAPRLREAARIAERIRQEFSAMSTRHDGAWIRHTLSGGLTVALADGEEMSLMEALNRADAALYEAKATGRNRIMLYDPADGPLPVEAALRDEGISRDGRSRRPRPDQSPR